MSARAFRNKDSHGDSDQPVTSRLLGLVPAVTDELYGIWHTARPRPGESCRWERTEREWVIIELGEGEDIGSIVIQDWRGQFQRVDSYEAALRLARCWCR